MSIIGHSKKREPCVNSWIDPCHPNSFLDSPRSFIINSKKYSIEQMSQKSIRFISKYLILVLNKRIILYEKSIYSKHAKIEFNISLFFRPPNRKKILSKS